MVMSLIKKVMSVLILLLIITIAWVGSSLYLQSIELDINPNATSYTKPINKSFDTETLDELTTRTEESFPVSPQEFLRLNQLD